MKGLSVVLCIALLFAGVPLVKAQEQPAAAQPAAEPPVIPPDIAEELGGLGMAPLISLGFDFIFALVNGVIASIMAAIGALWARGLGSLFSVCMAWCNAICGFFPIMTYVGACTSAILFVMRYIPCVAYIPNCWNAIKVTAQTLGI